ncbi:ExbD/TolR family protein [Pseudoduganella violaceinigra]|uniref:ExbD/TolR family protein n=1 Tax=Pseudoduganella violaceinigra TaxID=246602 RepID=UPI00040B169E|nr:biopolymer transporter ExbD [Pseudoduganella violaceinigra]
MRYARKAAVLSSSTEAEPLNQLNMTPLIDVMLVLIIMLIVTIPKASHYVGMNMPTAGGESKSVAQTLEVDFDGTLWWNGAQLASRTALEEKLSSLKGDDSVQLRSNGLAPYRIVAGILSSAQRLGVRNIAMAGNERFQ